ncbi:MAG: efflux RND transporter periplasmic adaptor subunit [Spirochaetota bacterium]
MKSGLLGSIGRIGIAVAAVVALAACSDSPDAATVATADDALARADETGPIAVEAVELRWERLVGDISGSGLIRGAHEVTVVSEAQGVIQDVGFELGGSVEEGQLLVELDDSIQTLAVEEARAAVASAELDLQATERLVSSGNASQMQLAGARTTLAGARARLAQAQKAQDDRTIEAPIAGVIASMDDAIQAGNSISPGTPVARIIDTTELEVMLSIGEREIQYVAEGADAYVSLPAAGSREIPGVVHAIAAGSDPGTGSFPVVVRWENTVGEQARAGLSASVRILPTDAPWAITVPANAIQREADERYLYVVSPDEFARRRVVQTGSRTGDRVVVRSGLEAGERVIVSGLGSITDGTRVAATLRVVTR